MSHPAGLESLTRAWRRRAAGAGAQVRVALLFAVLIGGAHLARLGTNTARAAVLTCFSLAVALLVYRAFRDRRDFADPAQTIRRILVPTDRALAGRALRALTLVEETQKDATRGAPELARLHFDRLLRSASVAAVETVAARRGHRYRGVALAILLLGLAAAIVSPIRIVEGLDVLAARDGRAPVEMTFLRYPRVTAQPPAYTRHSDRSLVLGSVVALPAGSIVTVRGVPKYEDRQLVLTDGTHEVPFVGDGSGGLVARYTVGDTALVRVASKYGRVAIEEEQALVVNAVADVAPVIVLEGAPRTERLADASAIEVRWKARDDYGLRQVDLVLRSGSREERRTLQRYDGETDIEQGGYVLEPRDAFFKRAFLPVRITVEAKDNDPVSGPKWGESKAIEVVPAAVGQAEAKRYAALVSLRTALVHLAAETPDPADPAALRQSVAAIADQARHALGASYGGLEIPDGLAAFVRGQLEKLDKNFEPSDLEGIVLAIDVAVRSLGDRDAQNVSKNLGDVAEEIATAARVARDAEDRKGGLERLDTALRAAAAGADQLVQLDTLGRDLGTLAQSELRRIGRARQHDDLTHTELAALHLAARLRRPAPSFGAAGGRGGVESGMGRGGASEGAVPPSQADQRFDQLAQEISRLAREHGDSLDTVERALSEAADSLDAESLREEANRRARALREATDPLPAPGQTPGTRRASEALLREHTSAMAHALEKLALQDAVESGENALSTLEEALKRPGLGLATDEELDRLRRELEQAVAWSRERLGELQRSAEAQAKSALEAAGKREGSMAERAAALSDEGRSDEAPLPEALADRLEQARRLMQQAAEALERGQGQAGLQLQKEAQRLLEGAESGKTGETSKQPPRSPRDRESGGQRGDGDELATGGDVPDEQADQAAESFRERVLRGLGQKKSDRLSPAVRRYAEGLLQ